MTDLSNQILQSLQKAIKKQWPSVELSEIVLEKPKDTNHGDYATNIAFALASKAKKNPKEVADVLIQELSKNPLFKKVEAINGFVNFFVAEKFFQENIRQILKDKNFGSNKELKGKKIIIEHTQPNPFKTFHIGHLMNNAIGESITRIIRSSGATVKTATYHGDVGLHVAKAIWSLLEDKKKNDEKYLAVKKSGPSEAIKYIGEAYVHGNLRYIGGITEEGEKKDREAIHLINKEIYDRSNNEVNEEYDWGRRVSLEYFEALYKRLDSIFDYHFYETQAGEVGKKLVLDGLEKKIFIKGISEKADGKEPVVFPGEQYGLHTRVFLNSDGLPTYEGKEVGLAKIKKSKFNYHNSITITANEQDSFFDVVEVAIGQVLPELKNKMMHLSHGMLKLPSGKMSSRTGTVIGAEDLITEVKEKVSEKIKERDLLENEKEGIMENVALGALKYSIVKQSIGSDIIYDFEKSVSFEGDSGPYLQYSYARAKSILRKAQTERIKVSFKHSPVEVSQLEKMMVYFPEVVKKASHEYQPHYIATYITELAREFNNYYAHNKIVDKEDQFSGYKVALTEAFSVIMKNGLWLLGINVLEKM